jgi:hypothetical protein
MNQDALSIQNHEPNRKTQEDKSVETIGNSQDSVGKILKKGLKYTNKYERNKTIYEIKIDQKVLDNNCRVLTCKIKAICEDKKEVIYTFEIGIDSSWKIAEYNYNTDNDIPVQSVQWFKIRYIQKIDKNNKWPRFSIHGEPIQSFWYFKYLSLDISHDDFVREIKQSLIYLNGKYI